MLATPAAFDPAALARTLEAVMSEADVACLLVALDPSAEREVWEAALTALLPVAQARECAVLLSHRFDLIDAYGADGIHSERGRAELEVDVETMKPRLIVGAGELRSRHDAMEAGEAGVDYVLFGRRAEDANKGASDPDHVLSRVAWWAELFEVPCVGVAADAEAVSNLAEAGADFIMPAVGFWNGDAPRLAARAQTEIDTAFTLRKARLAERLQGA